MASPNSAEGAFPLSWPPGWKRTAANDRKGNPFMKASWEAARRALWAELERLGASAAVISSNLPLRLDGFPKANGGPVEDPGVAVYFTMPSSNGSTGRRMALACDRWTRLEQNLRAIGLHVEALRGMERWGVGSIDQAFTGYLALPAPGQAQASRSWREVFAVDWSSWGFDQDDVQERYRELSRVRHPDAGGSQAAFAELARARSEALDELRRRGA